MFRYYAAIIMLCFVPPGISQDSGDFEQITVVSNKPTMAYEVAFSVDQIDAEFIEKTQPKDLTSLLRENLAIDVSNNGGLGQLSSIFLRGSNSNHTLVKVNGIKINPSTAGGASIYNLDTQLISNIEIGHGPLSSLHGSSAIGGAMNVSTFPKERVSDYLIGLNFGPDNYQKKLIKLNHNISQNTFLNFSSSETNTDGFPALTNSDLDRGYENNTFIGNFEMINDFVNLRFSSWFADGRVEYLVFGSPVSQDYENYAHGLEAENFIENLLSYKINLSSSKDLIEQNNRNFLGQIDKTDTSRNYFELSLADIAIFKSPDRHVFGLNIEDEKIEYSSYGTIYNETISTKSFFGSSIFEFSEAELKTSFRNTDHDIYKSNLSWNIELLKGINRGWKIGILRGSSFRSPVSSELYGFGGNLNLEPEINRSTEVSLKRVEDNFDLSLSVFQNDLTNLITFDYQDYVLKNISESSNKGLEIRYRLKTDKWDLSLILKSQRPEDNDGNQLLRRSKRSSSLTLTRDFQGILSTLNVSSFGEKVDFGNIKLPSYSLINLSFLKELNRNTSISLRLENILDKDYYTAASSNDFYLNQDRALWLRLNHKFGK